MTAIIVSLFAASCGSDDSETPSDSPGAGDSDAGNDTSPGNGQVGDSCTTNLDCSDPPDAECLIDQWAAFGTTFPSGYCSKGCIEEDPIEEGGGPTIDCGTGSCIRESGGMITTAFCAKLCDGDSECRVDEGYACKRLPIVNIGYCAPL